MAKNSKEVLDVDKYHFVLIWTDSKISIIFTINLSPKFLLGFKKIKRLNRKIT